MLRGTHPAKIDDKGRLKVPTAFRTLVESQHGTTVYVTSLTGEFVSVYPMPVWMALEDRLKKMPSSHPARLRFLDRVNYFGQLSDLDSQGRVVISQRLRDSAGMAGDVDVLGQVDYLDVWNHERFLAKLQRDPFTDADARTLAEFGI